MTHLKIRPEIRTDNRQKKTKCKVVKNLKNNAHQFQQSVISNQNSCECSPNPSQNGKGQQTADNKARVDVGKGNLHFSL